MERTHLQLVMTECEKINFHHFMDIYFPEVKINMNTHRVDCPCGECHDFFMARYLLHLSENN